MQEAHVVGPGREEAAATAEDRRALGEGVGERLQFAIGMALVAGRQARAQVGAEQEAGVAHAERVEDVGAEEVFERLPADPLDHAPGPVGVRPILPALARVAHQRQFERGIPRLRRCW
ncbi:MAG: hypothetical protein U0232_24715 [Thermomicrobiales bacterium]